MKELVLKIENVSIRMEEAQFNLFFVKPLFLLLIYFGVYSRKTGLIGLTGGQTTVVISFGLFCLTVAHILFFNRTFRLSKFSYFISIFFVLSAIFPFLTTFVFGSSPIRILLYSIEIGINFCMFFSIYYFVKEKVITPKFFLYSIGILGIIAALLYLKVLLQSVSIFRLRGLTGLNTLGNSFALGVFAWVMIMYVDAQRDISRMKKYSVFLCIIILIISMLFTGTRAAIIALGVGLMAFQFLGMKSKYFTRYLIIFMIGIAIVLVIFALNFNMAHFWGRFTSESVIRMANLRFSIYMRAVNDLTLPDFIFGRPDFYIFSNDADNYINPHNLFLGIIRYNGILLFIQLVFIFMALFYKYYLLYRQHRYKKHYRVVESSIIILFLMVVIYTMFSGGRTTRSFNFFITLGYAVGYFELFKNLNSYEDYEELIL